MTRPLRPGDRVTATGTVLRIAPTLIDPEIVCAVITFDGDRYETGEGTALSLEALTLIEPAEPPVGSVVVKDGEAFLRRAEVEAGWIGLQGRGQRPWSDLSDGEIIFRVGEES